MHKKVYARWIVVTERRTLNGTQEEVAVIDGRELPWRILKRRTVAFRMGLDYVRSLGDDGQVPAGGVVAVSVCDDKRALASWRRMDKLAGYTGTHDTHPLISEHLKVH